MRDLHDLIKITIQAYIDARTAYQEERKKPNLDGNILNGLNTTTLIQAVVKKIPPTTSSAHSTSTSINPDLLFFIHELIKKLKLFPGKDSEVTESLNNLLLPTHTADSIVKALGLTINSDRLATEQLFALTTALAALKEAEITEILKQEKSTRLAAHKKTVTDAKGKPKENTAIRFGNISDVPSTVVAEINGKPASFNETQYLAQFDQLDQKESANTLAWLLGPLSELDPEERSNITTLTEASEIYTAINNMLPNSDLVKHLQTLNEQRRNDFISSLALFIRKLPAGEDNIQKYFSNRRKQTTAEILTELAGTVEQERRQLELNFEKYIVKQLPSYDPSQPINEQELIELLEPFTLLTQPNIQRILNIPDINTFESELRNSLDNNSKLIIFLDTLNADDKRNFLASFKHLTKLSSIEKNYRQHSSDRSKTGLEAHFQETHQAQIVSDDAEEKKEESRSKTKTVDTLIGLTDLDEKQAKLIVKLHENIINVLPRRHTSANQLAPTDISNQDKTTLLKNANTAIKGLAKNIFPHDWKGAQFAAHIIRNLFFYQVAKGGALPLFSNETELNLQIQKAESFLQENDLPELIKNVRNQITYHGIEKDFTEQQVLLNIQKEIYCEDKFEKKTPEKVISIYSSPINITNLELYNIIIKSKIIALAVRDECNEQNAPHWFIKYLLTFPSLLDLRKAEKYSDDLDSYKVHIKKSFKKIIAKLLADSKESLGPIFALIQQLKKLDALNGLSKIHNKHATSLNDIERKLITEENEKSLILPNLFYTLVLTLSYINQLPKNSPLQLASIDLYENLQQIINKIDTYSEDTLSPWIEYINAFHAVLSENASHDDIKKYLEKANIIYTTSNLDQSAKEIFKKEHKDFSEILLSKIIMIANLANLQKIADSTTANTLCTQIQSLVALYAFDYDKQARLEVALNFIKSATQLANNINKDSLTAYVNAYQSLTQQEVDSPLKKAANTFLHARIFNDNDVDEKDKTNANNLFTEIKNLIEYNQSTPEELSTVCDYIKALSNFTQNKTAGSFQDYVDALKNLTKTENSIVLPVNFLETENAFIQESFTAINTQNDKELADAKTALDKACDPVIEDLKILESKWCFSAEGLENVSNCRTALNNLKKDPTQAHLSAYSADLKNKANEANNAGRRYRRTFPTAGTAVVIAAGAVATFFTAGLALPFIIAAAAGFSLCTGSAVFSNERRRGLDYKLSNDSIHTTANTVIKLQTESETLKQAKQDYEAATGKPLERPGQTAELPAVSTTGIFGRIFGWGGNTHQPVATDEQLTARNNSRSYK